MSGNVTDLLDSRIRAILEQAAQLPDSGSPGSAAIRKQFMAACAQIETALKRKDDLNNKLSAYDQKSRQILSQLNDPEWGPVGQAALSTAAECHVQERVRPCVYASDYDDKEEPYLPTYASFSFDPDEYGLVNAINIDPVNTTFSRLFRGKVHELVHATALAKSPVLHASPWNPATDVVLCPRDFVRVILLSERDAYAKEPWLCHLARPFLPDIDVTCDNAPVKPRWFKDMKEIGGKLPFLLQKAAIDSLDIQHKSELGVIKTYKDHYIRWALEAYKKALDIREQKKMPIPTCVRLEDEDILSVGDSYGPNVFKDQSGRLIDVYREIPEFTKEQQVLIDALNKRLGINFSEDRLRNTLGTYLQSTGRTKAEYLHDSNNQGAVKITEKPAPKLEVIAGGLDGGPA